MSTYSNAHPALRGLMATWWRAWTRPAPPRPPRERRHYPPKRDQVIETAAMAREMYRL
ncbi:hypothetical protein [Mycobacterium sp. C31M]